jgi:methyltransferase (TIGR00027 family)
MKEDQASLTAFTVAQGFLYAAKQPQYQHLSCDGQTQIIEQILQDHEQGRKMLRQLESKLHLLGIKLKEKLLLPGVSLHYLLRKYHVEQLTRKSLENGVTQVIMLGAGFDTLCWRLHQDMPQVNFIEIDHPATQRVKMKALTKGTESGENLSFLPVDFSRQSLKSALEAFDDFDSDRQTLFICEGVLMYLSEQDVHLLFDSIRQLTSKGTEFIFSTLEPKDSPKNTVPGLLYFYLKSVGEPVIWDIDSSAMAQFVQQHQCRVHSLAGTEQFLSEYLKEGFDQNMHKGEYFVHCSFE